MSERYFLSFRRRIGRQLAAGINSLGQLRDRIAGETERAAQRAVGSNGSLVLIPVKTAVGRRLTSVDHD